MTSAKTKNINTTPGGSRDTSKEELLSQSDVLRLWPMLSKSVLTIARKAGRIAWVRGKRGSAWYRAASIETFIKQELEQPCHAQESGRCSPSVANGSPTTQLQSTSTVSGLNQELEERVAKASALRIWAKQN